MFKAGKKVEGVGGDIEVGSKATWKCFFKFWRKSSTGKSRSRAAPRIKTTWDMRSILSICGPFASDTTGLAESDASNQEKKPRRDDDIFWVSMNTDSYFSRRVVVKDDFNNLEAVRITFRILVTAPDRPATSNLLFCLTLGSQKRDGFADTAQTQGKRGSVYSPQQSSSFGLTNSEDPFFVYWDTLLSAFLSISHSRDADLKVFAWVYEGKLAIVTASSGKPQRSRGVSIRQRRRDMKISKGHAKADALAIAQCDNRAFEASCVSCSTGLVGPAHEIPGEDNVGSWCNAYEPQPRIFEQTLPESELYGPHPYDVNFCFPYLPEALRNKSLALVPFIPRLHAEKLFEHARHHPEDFQYMRFPIPKTLEGMLAWFELTFRRNPFYMAYTALYADGIGNWEVGGVIALIECSEETLTAEIGMGLTFQNFRGKSRALETVAMLMRYCLNVPTDQVPGLGLRKVGWTAHANNRLPQVIPLALGSRLESMKRWNRVAHDGKVGNGKAPRKGDRIGLPGVDDLFFVMCWDDWEADGRRAAEAVLGKRDKAKL
ncbi:hypothetical protein SCHPADRAFT_930104 [Schizopora paradoxa]|uniref:N-acetyltransferase domain-containing protein n=1 Tax=Schizopora paradoxa TaxID=27342 RepID=A0A0H2S2C2_9AGAM|nr:hypothetical protein SCHPADRAFT_930104 [Schizopora paradoxa]